MAKIYEFAVLFNQPKSEITSTNVPKLIVPPTTLLADSDDEARIKAARAIPEEYIDRLSQVDIAVRVF